MEGEPGTDQLENENIDEEEEEEEEEGEEDEETVVTNLFQQLFESYQKISAQLYSEDGMEEVLREYTRLFEAAKSWHVESDEMAERVVALEEELRSVSFKYSECKEYAIGLRTEVAQLKKELDETMRLADTAHTREQNTMEVVTGLRTELARISKELGQKTRLAGSTVDDDPLAMAKKLQESEVKEQDRLSSELAVVRERLERAVSHSREVEKNNMEREKRVEELAELLEAQETETNKEMRLKERYEAELNTARNDLEQREAEFHTLSEQYERMSKEFKTLSDTHKELRTKTERMQRDKELLTSRNNRLVQEQASRETLINNLRLEIDQRKKLFKSMEFEMLRQRKEMSHMQQLREAATRKAEMASVARSEVLQELDRIRFTVIVGMERDLRLAQQHALADTRAIERLNRDKDILSKTLTRCQEMSAEQTQTLRLQEQARRAMADELDIHTINSRRQRKQINGLEMERDRLIMQTTELEVRVEETLEEVRLKQMAVYEGNRRVAEGEARFRQQQNLYEAVRADRNTFAKHLLEAQDEISELKQKLKVQGHHVEQMKEDISSKEVDLRRAMKTVDKTEKEKEALRVELQSTRDQLSQARAEIAAGAAEERRLLGVIQEAENEHRHMVMEMEQMTNERDILGSQLVRRNDELALLYEKIRLLELALQKGESQYAQRLEDIRLLKVEVRRLRNEKILLQRSLDNMAKLRKEAFHLERDLTRERQKTRALEEELQNPLNVHRWRKLQGTDPTTFDLIEKVQLLQKRLLAQAAVAIDREAQLRDAERLYAGLRSLLQRQPGPEVAVTLHRTQQALRERGRRMKVLVAEANMYEAQVTEYKSALERAQTEAEGLKRKNLEQRRRERRLKAKSAGPGAGQGAGAAEGKAAGGDAQAGALVPYIPPPNGRRFLGGGFNFCPPKA